MSFLMNEPRRKKPGHERSQSFRSANEASYTCKIADIKTIGINDIVYAVNNDVDQTAWMRRLICNFVVRICLTVVFSRRRSYTIITI